uniref:Uncharacterized protein n=1 Tax=Lygus hesperus TaxID=30085 RepID=A0A0K8SJB4_LYGHE
MASDDHCKTILQFFMLERVITVSSLADLMERITGSASNSDALINKINERIQEFSQKIVKATCEVTGDKMYVMIFTADEADVKSQLTKDQIDYFYPLMNNIITSSGSLALITALNMAPAVTMARVSLADAEKYIELFVLKRLLLLENGFLYLSPLTIAEFGPYITRKLRLGPLHALQENARLRRIVPQLQRPYSRSVLQGLPAKQQESCQVSSMQGTIECSCLNP